MENVLPPANPQANLRNYQETYQTFDWEDIAQEFSWHQTGKINIAYEAIDRHAEDPMRSNRFCLIYEDEHRKERITYHQMRDLSNKFANVLKKLGVKKGDRVFIFLPRCSEYYIAMAGCAKVGAIFSPLFEALMEMALRERLKDGGAKVLVTTPRMAARVPFSEFPDLNHIILVGSGNIVLRPGEVSWEEEMAGASYDFDIEWMDLEDPLYIIYTSGSTGDPKGVLHVHRDMIGYLITARWVLDLRDDDCLWTTSEPGWITGTVYGVFAPWLCGVNNFVRGGRFDLEGWCRSIEANRITVWYSSPTVFTRMMEREKDIAQTCDLSSVRHILSVGGTLSSEVVFWARRFFKIPIHDTWWMTETGMIMIANYPGMPIKPGSIGKPFPGIVAAIVDEQGNTLPPLTLGNLAIRKGWPAMMRGIWRDETRYQAYFTREPWYISGDLAYEDEDGYFYLQGREDYQIKVDGVMVSTTEVEEALRRHPAVGDAGVVGNPDAQRGTAIKAFIALKPGFSPSAEVQEEIREFMRRYFSPRLVPKEIEFRPEIPRGRDGMVIRRSLKAWALGLPG
ncbi:MAG: acetate--CoA ligase [Deltaproteobacteria bacterium RBG_16_54_18]|nr:MAG: acetate--CoA ligase [Deltaproteobacteria bacterium RBG_16_54_18]